MASPPSIAGKTRPIQTNGQSAYRNYPMVFNDRRDEHHAKNVSQITGIMLFRTEISL